LLRADTSHAFRSCVSLSARAFASAHPQRSALVHALVAALRLPVRLLRHGAASEEELSEYHSPAYIEALRCASAPGAGDASPDSRLEAFGLAHDCPPFEGALEYARLVAGGSLAAADALFPTPGGAAKRAPPPRVAIHWDGGRHHASRGAAAGFCFVNDVVLAAQRLLRRGARRVLYIDVDVHHCDAVAGAFYRSDAVLVVSLHMHGPGVYPGTGHGDERGAGRGAGHTLNLPLAPGLRDALFIEAFDVLCAGAAELYRPHAVLLCAGADGLAGDPLGCWSLSPTALAHAAAKAKSWGAPLLVLGGGGYAAANTARAWAAVTAALCGDPPSLAAAIPDAPVPDHEAMLSYGPSYAMWDQQPLRADENVRDDVIARCHDLLQALREQYEADGDAADEPKAAAGDETAAAGDATALPDDDPQAD
jgi:acetoin utilization deacetylase AcuC-like enzyme